MSTIDTAVPAEPAAPERLTKEQAAVIGAYTGILCGQFADLHEYAEHVLGRPVLTHEFGTRAVADELEAAARDDFLALCAPGTPLPAVSR